MRASAMPTLECITCRGHVSYAELDEVPYRPFCSRRCQLIDLNKWLNEEYRISETLPGARDPEPEQSAGDESEPDQ